MACARIFLHCSLFFLLYSLISFSGAPVAQAQPLRQKEAPREIMLEAIEVLGLPPEQERQVRSSVPVSPGEAWTRQAVSELTRNLRALDIVPDSVKIGLVPVNGASGKAPSVRLVLDFRPPAKVASIDVFSLIPGVESERLEVEGPLQPGLPAEEAALRAQMARLAEQARALGAVDAQVVPFEDVVSTGTVALGFIVETRGAVELDELDYDGGGFFQSIMLENKLAATRPRAFDEGTTFTASDILRIRDLSVQYYRSLGYLEARVWPKEIGVDAEGEACLDFEVVRGPRYSIAEVRVSGFSQVPEEKGQAIAQNLVGEDFTEARFYGLKKDLREYCQTYGYMGATVELNHGVNAREKEVAIRARVAEGTQTRLGDIIVNHEPMRDPPENPDAFYNRLRHWMSPPLKDSVIRHQVREASGDAIYYESLEYIRRSLAGTSALEDLKVDTAPTSRSHVRNIVISGADKRSGVINLVAGWSGDRGPAGGLQIREGNIAGLGDTAGIQFFGSGEHFLVELFYRDKNWLWAETFLGHRRMPSLRYNVHWKDARFDEYTERRVGAGLELRYRREDTRSPWRTSWKARAEAVSLEPKEDENDYAEDFAGYPLGTLRFGQIWDTRDNGRFSSEGTWLDAGVEAGYARSLLLKPEVAGEAYYSLSKRFSLALAGKLGFLPFDSDKVAIGERFHGGGAEDLRGFAYRGIGPVDEKEEDLHTGGQSKVLLQSELRYRLVSELYPLLFLDVGSVEEDLLTWPDWRASGGGGLRFKLPGFNNEVFLFISQPFLSEDTDEEETVQFGMRIAF